MIRALLVFIVGTLIIACTTSTEPVADTESCVFVKEAYWLSLGHQLPVPDSLMQSDRWDIDARWWLGSEVTTFRATSEGCLVVNH